MSAAVKKSDYDKPVAMLGLVCIFHIPKSITLSLLFFLVLNMYPVVYRIYKPCFVFVQHCVCAALKKWKTHPLLQILK